MAKRNGGWVDLGENRNLTSNQVLGAMPGRLSLWEATALRDMKAVSRALADIGFLDATTEEALDVVDIEITSVPWAGLTDDAQYTVHIKLKPGTVIEDRWLE